MKKIMGIILATLLITSNIPVIRADAAGEEDVFTKAYITSFNTEVVDVVDLSNHTVEKAKITVGRMPNSAAINPNGKQVFVTNRADATVSIIDPITDTVKQIIVVGSSPHGVAFNGDGSRAYVANRGSDTLSVIDTETYSVDANIEVSGDPTALVRVGQKLYVTREGDNKVSIVDITTDQVIGEISVGRKPYGLSVNSDGTKVYVANKEDNSVSVINVADDSVDTSITVGSEPHSTEVTPDGSRVYVSNADSNNVSVIDTANNTVVDTISVDNGPYVIGISGDGTHAYTINYSGNSMSVIDTSSNEVIDTLSLSPAPFMVGTFMVPTAVYKEATAIKSTNADLSGLNVSQGTLDPIFDSETTDYSVNVENEVETMTVTATAEDANSTVKVNGIEVTSGQASENINLNVGSNIITVDVTAEDSITTKAYNILVKRSPAQPTLQSAVPGNQSVKLLWDSVEGAKGYDIFASTISGEYENPVMTVSESVYEYNVTELNNGIPYYFVIKATNDGAESKYSNEVSATPQIPVPSAPVIQSVISGDQHAQLSWGEVPGATSYNIYTSTVSDSYSTVYDTVYGTVYNYEAENLTNGTTYYFIVKAVNDGGESPKSNEVSATPQVPAPGAPTIQSVTPGDQRAQLSWGEVPGATSYNIYISTISDSYSTVYDRVYGTVYNYEAENLTNGTTYYFVVKAVNDGGESPKSNEVSATPQVPAPGAPVIQSVTPGDQHVQLSWGEVPGATSYNIYMSTVSDSYSTVYDRVYGTVYNYEAKNLTNGITYYFVVQAVNDGGESSKSNEVSAIPKTVPDAPENVKAAAGNGFARISFDAPADNGGSVITSYRVVSNPGNIIASGLETSIVVTGLTNGTKYTFTVNAVNEVGSSLDSLASNEVTPKAPSSSRRRESSEPDETKAKVIVNGKEHIAGIETLKEENGEKQVELVVNPELVNQRLKETIEDQLDLNSEDRNTLDNIIEIPVESKEAKKAKIVLTGDTVKKMDENQFKLSVQTSDINYIIPANDLEIEKAAQALGLDITDLEKIEVEVNINKADEKMVQKITELAKEQNYEIIFRPIELTITAKTKPSTGKEKEVKISKFTQYVERIIQIPAGVKPNNITTGILFNPDGTFSHIPTEVFIKDNKYFAKLNSLTNSTYSVISNQIRVESVENHWSKEHVNDMASRLVIKNPEDFMPNGEITRSEFAEYITKAIGIYRTKAAKETQFTDVAITSEFADAIVIAAEYGIIKGYTDGTFKPSAKISREEAMTMYARAMEIVKLGEVDNNRIYNYQDADQVSEWAYDAVKKTLSAGVFNGRTEDTIEPKGTFTYAEAATAIRNLLIEAKLINQ